MTELIEDEDGAPLPAFFQRGSALWKAGYDLYLLTRSEEEAAATADSIMPKLCKTMFPEGIPDSVLDN